MASTTSHADSSHNSDQEFKIKEAAELHVHEGKAKDINDGHLEACTICLQPITERAVAVPCNHLSFDFICLVSWLQEQPKCPLCKTEVTKVEYDWRSPEDFKTYTVKPRESAEEKPTTTTSRRLPHRRPNPSITFRRHRYVPQTALAPGSDPALERRRQVYRNHQFSLRVGANRISQYQDFTSQDFTASPQLQSRARMFLRRELLVFSFLDTHPRRGNRDFLIEYVVALLRSHELKGANGAIEDIVAEMLGRENARLLLHELEAWLRSPYESLGAWDAHVQYASLGTEYGGNRLASPRGARKTSSTSNQRPT